jgi:hypothetical protein
MTPSILGKGVAVMQTLDEAVAQAVFTARLLERALHDSGPWALEYGGQRLPAHKVFCGDHIHFRALLPQQCWLAAPDGVMSLLAGGETVSVRPFTHVGDGGFVLDWTIALGASVAA